MVNTESPCQGASSAPQLRPGWVEREGTTLKGGSGENVWVRVTNDSQTGALEVAKVYSNATLEQQPELKQMAYNEADFHLKHAGEAPSAVVPMINSHYDPELFVMGFPYAGRPLLSFVCQPLDAASLWRNALLGCEFVSRVVPAMRWLHGKGLVYLDFKPEQVLAQVDHQARRLLINWVDFGSLAPRGQCCVWTDGFVPPEALACCGDVVGINAAATEAWDAWAVGTVLMILQCCIW
ncbi:hypothetical protein MNEG_2772 [Monoraphidium neglectum]|uniref:Protein kinase domain-containing protein n=1 Tax=Monoraphidium neglectum TaxID=145388 RepID=A0A0D2MXW1_9CHLO|nr:hypothetical protein MNEG_2772 [Monoraphidium neglectum]KIZ05182.1 hypothetical protein MNEG_2772 [Monoraphidium neglectum]|eukprot:XP_013904201.1 hypothetical protein MNEG_2772 [Monoraphidium neglectum]